MPDWPALEPALTERLALPHDAFRRLTRELLTLAELPPYSEAVYERAITYPWARPVGSFVLDGEVVGPLEAATVREGECEDRFPLIAIGSNASPARLVEKLRHLPAEERRVLAVIGWLHGFDIGPHPRIAPYGSMPATLLPSAGTAVRATVLWVTLAQLSALTWSELAYHLGRLEPTHFEPDAAADVDRTAPVEAALVYVSRWGTFTEDGAPVALQALQARGRTAPARTQEALIARLATQLLGPGATGRDLVERLSGDFIGTLDALGPWLAEQAHPFAHPTWRPYPGTGAGPVAR